MNIIVFLWKRFSNFIGFIFCVVILLSCENRNNWDLKKQKFDKTESYNYSEYISGELDSVSKSQLEGSKQAIKHSNRLENKPLQQNDSKKNTPENPQTKPSILDKIWETISDFIDSVLNLL